MNIPDGLVYAAVPVMGSFAYWAGSQFVRSQTRPARPGNPEEVTVRQYRTIAELMKAELNGRYMFADEARDRFEQIEQRISDSTTELKVFIATHQKPEGKSHELDHAAPAGHHPAA